MDPILIGAIVAGGIGLFAAGHLNASWLAKARAATLKIEPAAKAVEQNAVGVLAHPIVAVEHALAAHDANTAAAAIDALWNDGAALAKIAEAQSEIEFRAALRSKLVSKINGLVPPVTVGEPQPLK